MPSLSGGGVIVQRNQTSDAAEDQGHHPDIFISYNRVRLTLWTHSVGGLSNNDFILAARIDRVFEGRD